MRFSAVVLAAALALPMATATAEAATRADLRVAAQSQEMIWNAVAVDRNRVFVSGPRWSGSRGPALARLSRGVPRPYPNAEWNSWQPGQDPAAKFVNINAIHHDGHGSLWAVDTGSPDFGGNPLPRAAKLVRINLRTNQVTRIHHFADSVALPGSYVDDVRFHGRHAYLTDAGRPGLIILDLVTGTARRVLDNHPSTVAPADRPLVLDGAVVRAPDGNPLRVHADPLELSPDRQWLYYGSLHGPWSRIATRDLDNPGLSAPELAARVEPWADLPAVGGTAMDRHGNLYFTDLVEHALKRRTPDGRISTVVQDQRLHWTDAPFLAPDGRIWLPVPQMDRVALFHGGQTRVQWPIQLFTVRP
ncbi:MULTISPECIES: major royal jelly family protein [unclassified Crossiella]|uniref:major royal jelly family protein n=1 Tax=unclassified Crossiella TaxID=2620835 RepID=UPI001FFF12CD|nr:MULTISPECIES: major royal jelly family protein [unclassified Crossiella]MCK2244689.1 major royal jelly family protein [Crossiella sp. S99.2]MCK2258324.1 major royal jelly family protein [Crossiella sp. S99.1]